MMHLHSTEVDRGVRRIPRTVLVAAYQAQSWLYKPLMVRMRERWGTRFVFIAPENVNPAEQYAEYAGRDAVYLRMPKFTSDGTAPPEHGANAGAVLGEARRIEERYGVNYTRDIYQQERGLAWGLLPGTPRPLRDNGGLQVAAARSANECFRVYEDILTKHDIDLALVWPRTGSEAICAIVAEQRGILVTYPYTAKFKEFAYWASGAECGNLQYRLAYEAVGECEPLPEAEIAPPARPTHLEQNRIDWRYSAFNALRQTALNCIDRPLLMLKDFRAGRFGWSSRRSLMSVLGEIWRDWAYFRKFAPLCERDVEKITGAPFVLFLFQNEPEFSVQMKCKDFNDQGAIARQIALSLPADMKLVIKEHTFLGGHRIDFYRDLVAMPNVIMAHPGLRAIDLIPKAVATASLASTASLEAAFHGRPAIIFSERSEFSFMPCIRVVNDMARLVEVIAELRNWSSQQALEARSAAARFAKATKAIGIEAKMYFTKDGSAIESHQTDLAADLLQDLMALHDAERAKGRRSLGAQ
jgi:hypothetical protein